MNGILLGVNIGRKSFSLPDAQAASSDDLFPLSSSLCGFSKFLAPFSNASEAPAFTRIQLPNKPFLASAVTSCPYCTIITHSGCSCAHVHALTTHIRQDILLVYLWLYNSSETSRHELHQSPKGVLRYLAPRCWQQVL